MAGTLIAILMLLASAAAAGCALLAAKLGAVDRLLSCLLEPESNDLASLVDHLTEIAGVAHCEGLLLVERHPVLRSEPILRHGVALALEGESPGSIRDRLLGETHTRSVKNGVLGVLPLVRFVQAAAIVLAAGVLVFFLVGGSTTGTIGPAAAAVAWFAICIAMIGIAIGSLAREPLDPMSGQLAVALQAETAALIAAGSDKAAVRSALLAMISPAPGPSAQLSRAA